MPDERIAFQDQIPENDCWGCGPHNAHGLRIKSYWDGDEAICIFQPSSWHRAGPPHILNGGIIATIIDCHSVCTAIAAMYLAEGREMTSAPHIWAATAALRLQYLKPTPIAGPVELRATLLTLTERKGIVACTLSAEGQECVTAETVAVRVKEEWRHGQRENYQ